MKTRSRRILTLVASVTFLGATILSGLLQTPETGTRIAPQWYYGALVNGAERTVVEKEREHDRREALGAALAVRLAELRAGVITPPAESLIDEQSLKRANTRAQARQIESEDDLLRAREQVLRYKKLRNASGGAIGMDCTASRENAQ